MFKILAIGNSFSIDSTKYLKDIAAYSGKDIMVYSVDIGGCSLERHAKCLKEKLTDHGLSINGAFVRKALLEEEVKAYDWDVITLQQVSNFSGMYETYQPYLDELVDFIRKEKPNTKIYLHKTWAYDHASTHRGFANYSNSQKLMADKITEAVSMAANAINADGIIPSGDVIAELRKLPEFDTEKGGQTLCRDGFHMHLYYGRYAAAATWYETLIGGDITDNAYMPPIENIGLITPDVLHKIDLIKKTVHKVCSK